jgi:Zn-dependent protease
MSPLTPVRFAEFLIQYSFFLLSASVHESSHAWTAFKFGDPTAKLQNRISLNPMNHIDLVGTVIIPFVVFLSGVPVLGWAKPTPFNPANFKEPRKASMFVSVAGPVSNFLTVSVLAILWHIASAFHPESNHIAALFCYVLGVGVLVNLVLGVFNMVPIYPLDGSGVMEGLLPVALARQYAKLRRFGFVLLLAFFYIPACQGIIWTVVIFFLRLFGVNWVRLQDIW